MTTLVVAPARADGVQLIGEMVGSGYRTPPALVRRGDGQTFQLTPLLYLVLGAVDGRRSHAAIAALVGRAIGRDVSADDVARLIDQHLRPLGLLKLADGTEPELRRSDPLLGLKPKVAVTDPRTTARLTDPFRVLFRPLVAWPVVIGFLAVTWWVFFDQGLAPAAYDAFERPQLLLLVFAVTVLSGGFHEFGHAAAARHSGATPGVIGAGIYLVWPAFYTDVTDSYRLSRRGRVLTDLGGLYFNAVVVVATFAWWYVAQWDALLLLVATQVFQMAQQLLPLLRFDGYHLLADLAGVPDLYHRIGPTLRGLLPHRWSDPVNQVLKPWARVVITGWVLLTVPMMALMLAAVVRAVPRLLGTAWKVVSEDAAGALGAWRGGDPLDIAAHSLQALAVMLPLLACVLILGRVGLRWFRGLARWSRGSLRKRVTAAALSTLVVTGLSWAWWPHPGTYRPILPDERGLFQTLLPAAQGTPAATGLPSSSPGATPVSATAGAAAERRLGTGAPLVASFPEGEQPPDEDEPQLAIVLVPSEDRESDGDGDGADQPAGQDPVAQPWVFPFDQPLPPGEGDNQAAAYNTTDGSVTYDIAFALVWATGDEVLNVNEAHAYASCTDCVTVAVAFQVVLIMDDAQVVVPQNLSVAANYECLRCTTAAVASQLVLSVEGAPGETQLVALADLWERLTRFGNTMTAYSLSEITARLEEFKAEIIAILGTAAGDEASSDSDTALVDEPEPSTTSTTSPSPQPTTSPDTSASPSETAEPTSEPTTEPTTEPTSEPTTESPTEPTTESPTEPTESPTSDPSTDTTTSSPSPSPSP